MALVSNSCGALVASPSFPVGIGSEPLLDAAVSACAAAADNRNVPHRYAITTSGTITTIGADAGFGGAVTDGMGAGGRNSTTGLDTADVQAAPGEPAAITLRCSRSTWRIPATTSRSTSMISCRSGWWGDTLPAAGNRTYRSKVGGKVRVRAYSATGAESGQSTFFSFTIPCPDDVACGSHGICNIANGTGAGYHGEKCSVGEGFVISRASYSLYNSEPVYPRTSVTASWSTRRAGATVWYSTCTSRPGIRTGWSARATTPRAAMRKALMLSPRAAYARIARTAAAARGSGWSTQLAPTRASLSTRPGPASAPRAGLIRHPASLTVLRIAIEMPTSFWIFH